MTREQKEKLAKEYADSMKEIRGELEWCATSNDFLAGLNARDEEVERLETELAVLENKCDSLKSLLAKAQNPWRDASVEKPPYDTDCDDDTSVYVIVRQEQGNVLEAYYDYDNNDWRDREHGWRLQDPTHWMPIPKGGEK